MDERALVEAMLAADASTRTVLLDEHRSLSSVALARALKTAYDQAKTSDPQRAAACAAALRAFATASDQAVVHAYANWVEGMATLQLLGEAEAAIGLLDAAIAGFEATGETEFVASVLVSKVYALAILGDYDQAIACGFQARTALLRGEDLLALGKIEQNLGGLYLRRDQYDQAEAFFQSARERYLLVGGERELAEVESNLAYVYTTQYNFQAAAGLYQQALARAKHGNNAVTQALIEVNLGWLALIEAKYDQALALLESAWRQYTHLGMVHEAATVELELADTYLELNLIPEAIAIYARIEATFAHLGMRAEQARTATNHAQACLRIGQFSHAEPLLAKAQALYTSEDNTVGIAGLRLIQAQVAYGQEHFAAAIEAAQLAARAFAAAGATGKTLFANWLIGESYRQLHQNDAAQTTLHAVLADAERQALPQIAQRCYAALGLLARDAGDLVHAEILFSRAIELTELLRAPLPGEEFRTAFVADKRTPYTELIRLCLAAERIEHAFAYLERARSRSLLDVLGGAVETLAQPRDHFEANLLLRLQSLGQELSWLYSEINRAANDDPHDLDEQQRLHTLVRERETSVLDLNRQLQQRGGIAGEAVLVSVAQVQHDLGTDACLVEYFSLDGQLLAFIVSSAGVRVQRNLGGEAEIEALIQQFFFQMSALRYGAGQIEVHAGQLRRRVQHYLARLYDRLIAPLEAELGGGRVVISPYRMLHYVPFHALYDGQHYVIEKREVSYTPSANVLHHCLSLERKSIGQAVLVGVADERAPHVRDELNTLAARFPSAVVLADEQATLPALREHAPSADVLHIASHGVFRPDNPLFSALQLGDGWLTVRDAYSLGLQCSLVTLSACETGVNAVAPGDELLGLVRGFFAAGSAGLLASLWSVDDSATAQLMADFYSRLQAGENPAAALRHAQIRAIQDQLHPFFWSAFVLVGRW